jgi:NAD(P)-dependent dehydrogenase (short-subunit alcohol dehydrogenase family)
MAKNLTGKVALATDGARGISAAIAKRLARDGAAVAITYAASADKAEAVVRALEGKGVCAVARPTRAMPGRSTDWSRRWCGVSVASTSWLSLQAGW